jgi:hypothetical protein
MAPSFQGSESKWENCRKKYCLKEIYAYLGLEED